MHMEKDVTMIISQRRLSLLGVCVLLLAIPYLFPRWDVYAAQLLRTHRLFIGALFLTLSYLLLWKYPQRQVAAIRDRKDRARRRILCRGHSQLSAGAGPADRRTLAHRY